MKLRWQIEDGKLTIIYSNTGALFVPKCRIVKYFSNQSSFSKWMLHRFTSQNNCF